MRESKAELTDRMRREGHWDAFKRRREELKAGGMAASDAWGVAAAEFPPPDTHRANGAAPAVNLRALKGKPAVPVVQAATWAFEYLGADWIKPVDAPSAGAWSMREWARTRRTEFYKLFAAKLVIPPQENACQDEEDAEAWERDLEKRLSGDLWPDPDPGRAARERKD